MPSRLNPYISFADNARQAMEFYQQVFGGELSLNTFGEYGRRRTRRVPTRSCTACSRPTNGFTLMGADTPPGMEYQPGNNMAGQPERRRRRRAARLLGEAVAGGNVSVPLEKQMWGDEFGMCEDQFGIAWMVNIAQPAGLRSGPRRVDDGRGQRR